MHTIENSRSTTGTATRVPDVNPVSGMCPICIEECQIMCEISKSAFRGREALYPSERYFGVSTASSNKDFFLDWSHFQILAELIGAHGVRPTPERAFFENVDLTSALANSSQKPIKLNIPILISALGSTAVAKRNWDCLAKGSAMSGTILTVGESVCGMDPEATYSKGRVLRSPDMEYRVESFRELWDGKTGEIAVQTSLEDQRGGVDDYALSKLEVNIIERKWGQGAKPLGGEVRLPSLERALELKRRGYFVLPDPEDGMVQAAYKAGAFKTFERHSRVGFPNRKSLIEEVESLKDRGARYVFLKTGAYRPEIIAFTMKIASDAKVDVVTFDGAGGGTGMSPVPMMNEMSTPTVHLEAEVLACVKILGLQHRFVPDIVMAGGFVNETQIFKSLAMSNINGGPTVRAIGLGRSPITAAAKASYFAKLAAENKLPRAFEEEYGNDPSKFFVLASEIQEKYPKAELGRRIPWGAVGLYTYFDRISVGLRQLLAGARKFKIEHLARDDICALSEYASKVTGIETFNVMSDRVIPGILEFWDE